MAQITDMPPGTRPVQIFDVTDKVGWGLRNLVEDVQLVQFAINKLAPKLRLLDFRKITANLGPGAQTFAPLAPLATDGKMGPETANAIRSYQNRVGSSLARDNTVDPVHVLSAGLTGDPTGGRYITTYSKMQARMIFHLNRDYLLQYGRVMNEPEFPPQLKAQITHPKR